MKRGEGGQEQIQAIKLQSYNKILDYTFLKYNNLQESYTTRTYGLLPRPYRGNASTSLHHSNCCYNHHLDRQNGQFVTRLMS